MAKAPAFQFYAADFLTDTAEMTDQEVGVYIRLLSHQWVNGSLHSDPKRLANGVAIGVLEVWQELEHKFPLCDDGRRRNQRLEETRQQQQDYRDKQAEAGRQGALKRWSKGKGSEPNGTPIDDPNSETNGEKIALQSSTSSSTSTKSSKNNNGDKSPSRFQEFWDVYADKRSRAEAEKVWKRKKLDGIAEEVISGARRYVQARGPDRKFWKQAQGWLNGERWADDVVPAADSNAGQFDNMNYGEGIQDL